MIQARSVSKSFPGVKALADVSLDVAPGRVHALVGENGAGKSTLLRILAGQLAADSGEVVLAGRVALIHQELTPFPELTVAENICMGREPVGRFPGWIDRGALRRRAETLLGRLGCALAPGRIVRTLSVAQMQMVEIARALAREADAVLMDEPTSALPAHEAEALFAVIRDLTSHGVAVVYTSHKMDEIFRISDTVTVLRDGQHVGTRAIGEVDEQQLIALMVGRKLDAPQAAGAFERGDPVLQVFFENVSFEARRGEIVGIAGLMGAGRTELACAIFGLAPVKGEIRVSGRRVEIRSPADAIAAGIAMVTEDRKGSGIVPGMSLKENLTLASLGRVCHGPWIDRRAENETADGQIEALGIKARRDQAVDSLSGGNQQKVMIAKALLTRPEVLILDEPTRGIDIGAKAEVHGMMRRLARSGKAIVMISSDMAEVLAVSDRILVMRSGELSAELDPRRTTQEEILKFAMPN